MNRAVQSSWVLRALWTLPAAACFAVVCGCSESSSPSVEAPPPDPEPADETLDPLPPPPAPDLSDFVVDEPVDQTQPEESSDPEEPDEQSDPPPDAPLTAEQARSAIEELDGRVALDESGVVVKVFLNRTQIDDEDLRVVEFLPNIKILNLAGTSITDAGLDHLHPLKKLRHLYPAKTGVTDQGLEELQQVLPDCKVYR